jgi:hypothetical protein
VIVQVTRTILILGLLVGGAGRPKAIVLNHDEVAEGAKNFHFTIKRTDGRPFTTQPSPPLWVGIAFGTELIKFKPTPDQRRFPRVLTVEIEDLDAGWIQAPRAGDNLLVAVYLGNKPITAATNLSVRAPSEGGEFHDNDSTKRKNSGCGVGRALIRRVSAPEPSGAESDHLAANQWAICWNGPRSVRGCRGTPSGRDYGRGGVSLD